MTFCWHYFGRWSQLVYQYCCLMWSWPVQLWDGKSLFAQKEEMKMSCLGFIRILIFALRRWWKGVYVGCILLTFQYAFWTMHISWIHTLMTFHKLNVTKPTGASNQIRKQHSQYTFQPLIRTTVTTMGGQLFYRYSFVWVCFFDPSIYFLLHKLKSILVENALTRSLKDSTASPCAFWAETWRKWGRESRGYWRKQ